MGRCLAAGRNQLSHDWFNILASALRVALCDGKPFTCAGSTSRLRTSPCLMHRDPTALAK